MLSSSWGRAVLPPEAPKEGPSCVFQLWAPGVPGLVTTSLPPLLCLHVTSPLGVPLSLPQILPLVTSAKTLFPNKIVSYSEVEQWF